jgi:hypothetical protein
VLINNLYATRLQVVKDAIDLAAVIVGDFVVREECSNQL